MTAHSVLNVRAALEWGNSELYKYYERNGLGYGTVHRPHPSRFLQLEHTPSRGPSTPRATCIPITLASCGEGLTTDSPPVGSSTEGPSTTDSYTVGPKIISPTATGSSDSATLVPATPILWESAGNPLSAGGAATSQAQGERSHL